MRLAPHNRSRRFSETARQTGGCHEKSHEPPSTALHFHHSLFPPVVQLASLPHPPQELRRYRPRSRLRPLETPDRHTRPLLQTIRRAPDRGCAVPHSPAVCLAARAAHSKGRAPRRSLDDPAKHQRCRCCPPRILKELRLVPPPANADRWSAPRPGCDQKQKLPIP